MKSRISVALLVAAGLLAATRAAAAETESTVTSVGYASVEKQPQFLRMTTELQVEGANLKEALEKLKARRDTIKTSLGKLGAIDKTMDLGEPRMAGAGGNNEREMMARMMRQRMGGATKPAAAAGAKSVTVSATVKCDIPLHGENTEALLVAANDLQEKIKAAKLFETPKSAAKSEEDEEMMGDMRGDEGPKPGEPIFLYVAKITDEEESKAAAEAFGKAKEAAGRLAKAAGTTLGALRSISSQANDMSGFEEYGYGRYNSYMQRYLQQGRQGAEGGAERESIAAQPGKITHQIFVSTTFAIK